jgi:hypothetical protein
MIEIVITTVIALIKPYVTKSEIAGKIISIIDMSFENLVSILPIGLESKNNIWDLSTFSAILLCMLVVADSKNSCNNIDLAKTPIM